MKKLSRGELSLVANRKRPSFSNQARKYYVAVLRLNGEDFPVMLTAGNLTLIRTRAQKQPEDSPAHSQLK